MPGLLVLWVLRVRCVLWVLRVPGLGHLLNPLSGGLAHLPHAILPLLLLLLLLLQGSLPLLFLLVHLPIIRIYLTLVRGDSRRRARSVAMPKLLQLCRLQRSSHLPSTGRHLREDGAGRVGKEGRAFLRIPMGRGILGISSVILRMPSDTLVEVARVGSIRPVFMQQARCAAERQKPVFFFL